MDPADQVGPESLGEMAGGGELEAGRGELGAGAGELGFIGLGEMGGRMAARLLAGGFALAVYDARTEAIAPLAALGASACDSAAEVASRVSTALLSLPTPEVVLAVASGPGGLSSSGSRLRTCVDLSTTGPAIERELARKLAAAGIALLDAPVSGGVKAAESGRLTVMAAGGAAQLAEVRPVLEHLAAHVFHVGEEPGLGQLAKVINNLLSATALAATAEAVALGVRCGLDAATLIDVLNASSGRNSATDDKFPRAILNRSFESGFALALMNKDVQLCLDEADDAGVPMTVGGTVGAVWAAAAAGARAGADCTELVKVFESAAGAQIGADAGRS